ncbi:hypothetical protein [Agrococcus casei]|uniref:hypothetical protein n=2 Tax=Agrococcus casei TaxID=343512 RepID=UPI003F93E51F
MSCTVAMPEIYLRTSLAKSNGTVYSGNVVSLLNVSADKTLHSNRAIACAGNNGTYRTETYVMFRAPTGVNPAYHSNTYYSTWRPVVCGATLIGPSDVSQAEIEITVFDDGSIVESSP